MYKVSSSLSLFRWRLTITRTMKKPWTLCPRRSSASQKQKILHLPNKKRDWLTCSTKSPSSRSLSKLAGKQRKSHFCCVLILNESCQLPWKRVWVLTPPLPSSSCRLYAEDAGEAVRLCEALLDEPELDPAVRIGDAYGFVVEHHCQQGNFQVVNPVFTFFFK